MKRYTGRKHCYNHDRERCAQCACKRCGFPIEPHGTSCTRCGADHDEYGNLLEEVTR